MEKRPILLESACIFSMIGSGFGFFYMLISTIFFNQMINFVVKYSNYLAAENLSPAYFASLMGAFALSLVGVIKIYRMQLSGIYFYLSAQILLAILPVIRMGFNALSYSNIIFVLLFSSIYLYHYRRLS